MTAISVLTVWNVSVPEMDHAQTNPPLAHGALHAVEDARHLFSDRRTQLEPVKPLTGVR